MDRLRQERSQRVVFRCRNRRVYAVIVFLIGILAFDTSFDWFNLLHFAGAVAIAALGGMLGVNMRERRRSFPRRGGRPNTRLGNGRGSLRLQKATAFGADKKKP